jgi:hypothetical protein
MYSAADIKYCAVSLCFSMQPSVPLSFQLGSHDMHQDYLLSHPATGWLRQRFTALHKLSTFVRVAAGRRAAPSEAEWLLRRVEPHRHDIAGASIVHVSKLLGDFMIGMRAGLDTPVEESVLMLGSFRFCISDCIPWLSWVSVVDGIDARRGRRSEASTGSSLSSTRSWLGSVPSLNAV